MSKNITKKEQLSFNQEVEKILKDNGFTPPTETRWRWERDTNVGGLKVSVHGYMKDSVLYSIFTQFDNPQLPKAKRNFDCNPHSGKYNFHVSSDGREEILENFKFFIRLVTSVDTES